MLCATVSHRLCRYTQRSCIHDSPLEYFFSFASGLASRGNLVVGGSDCHFDYYTFFQPLCSAFHFLWEGKRERKKSEQLLRRIEWRAWSDGYPWHLTKDRTVAAASATHFMMLYVCRNSMVERARTSRLERRKQFSNFKGTTEPKGGNESPVGTSPPSPDGAISGNLVLLTGTAMECKGDVVFLFGKRRKLFSETDEARRIEGATHKFIVAGISSYVSDTQ